MAVEQRELRSYAAMRSIMFGVVWLFGGLAVSLFCTGLLTAGSGAGRYVIATGAIGGGLGLLFRGVVLLRRHEYSGAKEAEVSIAKRAIVAALWLLASAALLVPGGIVTQIWEADRRFNERLVDSPLGKLCYRCNAPAVLSAQYDDGSIRYFCKEHDPPERMQRTSSGDRGQKGFNPWLCIAVLGGIYGVNSLRALVQLFSTAKLFRASLPGALIGVVTVVLAWCWFATR
ncbi:MAG TPA: hypothetical protein VG099_06935 [Gemmataceae bacterium]|nr:hypothetical protein [Gemmataceae bacterium]